MVGADDAARRLEAAEAELADVRRALGDAAESIERLDSGARERARQRGEWQSSVDGRLQTLELRARVPAVMAVAARAELARAPLVSVIMPTRNRAAILSRALESVREQTYPNWELVVVDDGGTDDTAAVVERLGDERIRLLRREHGGLCAARNTALSVARGELIAYLDDDNLMDPGWLRTVVWAFERAQDADVVFGAYVIDDVERLNDPDRRGSPGLVLNRFDRGRLAEANPADMSAIAHRAGLEQARFDESLTNLGDWELLARLTASKDPFAVPAIACYYGTEAGDRLSLKPPDPAELEAVRRACESPGGGSRPRLGPPS